MVKNIVLNARKMEEDIEKKLRNWNERSSFTIKGVRNLSHSDLESLKMYGDAIIAYGNYDCYMRPRGEVREVLVAYGLAKKESD